jgi:tetratricopeptide (TPR) repeat protein
LSLVFCSERVVCAALLLIGSAACGKKAAAPPPRYAVVRFENLSGDASLDWTGRAASEVLAWRLSGALDGPVLSDQALNRAAAGMGGNPQPRAKALLAGATRLIAGYVERGGSGFRICAYEEDLVTHRNVRVLSAEAPQPIEAIRQLVREFSNSARPYPTSNGEALKLYATALDESPENALPDLRKAVDRDPQFGPAWLSLVDATGLRGDRAALLDVIREALRHKIDPADSAAVQFEKAVLENDKEARVTALRAMMANNPGDLILLRNLAETEAGAGDFRGAAINWGKLREQAPDDRNAWNQLGYTLAWAGDYGKAIAALKEYAARWPDDPNALDSTGDVEYLYGKYAAASADYLKANEKNPQFLNGGELYKAAWAQFRAGDRAKADATFERFKTARGKSGDAGLIQFEGDWLYRTGRQKEAAALLRMKSVTVAQPAVAGALLSQLAIWDLLANDRTAAAKDATLAATKPSSNIGAVARFAALPSASAEEWERRGETLLRGSGADAARQFAVGVALLLDGKRDAARPVWDKIAQDASATDFFTRAVDARLNGRKPHFAILPDPMNVNQLLAMEERL